MECADRRMYVVALENLRKKNVSRLTDPRVGPGNTLAPLNPPILVPMHAFSLHRILSPVHQLVYCFTRFVTTSNEKIVFPGEAANDVSYPGEVEPGWSERNGSH